MKLLFISSPIKITFIFLLFFFPALVSGQQVKWSQPLQDNKKFPYLKILGEDDNENIFVLKSNLSLDNSRENAGFRNRSYLLQYFSPDLALLWEKDLKTSYEDGRITDIRLVNGKLITTSYFYEKKNKSYYFYSQYLGKDANWLGKPVLVDSLIATSLDENNKPGLINSLDQNLLAFSYRKVSKDDKIQSLNVVVLDTNLAAKYSKEILIPISTQLFVQQEVVLTNSGSFLLLGTRYTTEKKIKEPNQSYYELYGYNYLQDKFVHAVVKDDTKFLTEASIIPDNLNKSYVVAGFYSEKTMYSTAGIFYYTLAEDSLIDRQVVHAPFSQAYLQKFMGDQKENRELVNYTIDRLIVRKDGGVALIAESMYKTSRSYFDYYMQSYISHVYYHYGNVMVLSVNPDGSFLWNNVITKDQNSVDDGGLFSSYFCAVTGGKLAVVYNKFADENSSVLLTFINSNGNQQTEVLFNELEKVSIAAQSARQIDEETIVLPAFRQNKFYLIRINF